MSRILESSDLNHQGNVHGGYYVLHVTLELSSSQSRANQSVLTLPFSTEGPFLCPQLMRLQVFKMSVSFLLICIIEHQGLPYRVLAQNLRALGGYVILY
jgi:hypothetical protein